MTAAFYIARNEPFFLPLWVDYYNGQVDVLCVLDHDSDDDSTAGLPCEVVPVTTGGVCYDFPQLATIATTFQAKLLAEGYGPVVYTDVDEMLCHPLGLRRFLQEWRGECCRATGYQVVPGPGEAQYDAARPLLAQRGYWRRDPLYDKTLVSRVPLQWEVGFHFLEGHTNGPRAGGLTLLHLHHCDRDMARARHEARREWRWHEQQRSETRNGEQWTLEGAALEAWLVEAERGAEPMAGWLNEQGAF